MPGGTKPGQSSVEGVGQPRNQTFKLETGRVGRRMIKLKIDSPSNRPLQMLCLGSHADDIEIGCGGTILRIAADYPNSEFHWFVFSAIGPREDEARRAASQFVDPARL